jgi:antitoxin ParD1/3/4
MPTRNVNLTKHFDQYIEDNVTTGRFGNASEIVREGLRLLERQDKEEAAWNQYVTNAAQVGIEAMERGDYQTFESMDDLRAFVRKIGDDARTQVVRAGRKGA